MVKLFLGEYLRGMAVTCDHRIRSLATINKKTGFGSPVTTKCGHLRPQKVTFADRANKTQKWMRSPATTIRGHLRPKIGITWPGWVGWVGWGGVGWSRTLHLHTHTSRTHHLYSWVGGVGGRYHGRAQLTRGIFQANARLLRGAWWNTDMR